MNDQNKQTLERIENLLKHTLAVQLYQSGVTQQAIAQHLKMATAKANELLKGVERGYRQNKNSKP